MVLRLLRSPSLALHPNGKSVRQRFLVWMNVTLDAARISVDGKKEERGSNNAAPCSSSFVSCFV